MPRSACKSRGSYRGSDANFTATGLPPGLTINEYTGLISGTLTQGGSYTVTVTESSQALDGGTISGSATFTWTVSSGPPSTPAPSG